MSLDKLKPPKGAVKKRNRVGRGEATGNGKTCGRGQKGQGSRSGSKTPAWFEGGQMPMQRRLPKRGFSNYRFKKHYATINVRELEQFEAGTVIDDVLLIKEGLITNAGDGLKILGHGELSKALTVKAVKVTKGARTKIEAAGGTVEEI